MANKVAAVTGASRGIGKGIALALAGHGYDIAFSYCSAQEDAVRLQRRIEQEFGRRCETWRADLRELGAGPAFVEAAADRLGGLDVLDRKSTV